MTERARLIIPVWGERYAKKVLSITLPAVLAPGNLPELGRAFAIELVIVTESRLFDLFRGAPAVAAAERICKVLLVSLDDLVLDSAADYGITLTHAMFRGFADLGARMTETYLLFLNADFIVSDGSLRHLAQLMCQGKRLIHAPSFRVILEEVWPELQARVDPDLWTLNLPSREMAKLALMHKHPTVRARTVNQRLSHQKWMDQFYWYVDEETLIGYQAPVALVAIKPERVIRDPVLVWDFAFIPEAAPTLIPHFIVDSDEFFMIEPQSRETGSEMIRIGWVSTDEVAADLSRWLTKEHRESSKQLLTIHSGELPGDLDELIGQSRAYMAEVYRRMSPMPASYLDHPQLGQWFREVTARNASRAGPPLSPSTGSKAQSGRANAFAVAGPLRESTDSLLLKRLRAFYGRTFGAPPQVGTFHPLWIDVWPLARATAAWRQAGQSKVLLVSSSHSLLLRRLGGEHIDLAKALDGEIGNEAEGGPPYDACICALSLRELCTIERLYNNLRPLVKDGGHVLIYVAKQGSLYEGAHLLLQEVAFPSVDVSQIRFWGGVGTGLLARLYLRASRSFPSRPLARAVTIGATLVLLAPIVRLANARAARRDSTIYRPTWTSLTIEFIVRPLLSHAFVNASTASP
jgi:hypothetical protein